MTQWGTATLTYDANGNMTSSGTDGYTWDARNRLVSTLSGASFQYDPFGRRTSKTIGGVTTNFLYDGVNVVQELAAGTPLANLLSGGVDEVFTRTDGAGARNFMADGLGSTLALTDSIGTLQTQYAYEPFGNTAVTGTSANPFQYTGRENDGTGLYFYRARYYNPQLGRFVSEDPLGFGGGDTNLYAYGQDSPQNLLDPDGMSTAGDIAESGAAGGLIGFGSGLWNALANHNYPTASGQARLGLPNPDMNYGWERTFHFDYDPLHGYHFNSDRPWASPINHSQIPEWLSKLGNNQNLSRIGTGAAAAGLAIDLYRIGTADCQRLPGVIGGTFGGIGGAEVGAFLGTLIEPGLGTVVGGFLGGAAGGALGQQAGDALAGRNCALCH